MRGARDEGRTRLAACATGQATGDGWRKVRLGEICSRVCSGGTPKSGNRSFYDGGDIPWLNTKEVNFEDVYTTEKYITQAGFDNSAAKWVEPNSVIVAMYGATAGKSCITKIRLTTNQACCNMQIDEGLADYRFVYYMIRSHYEKLASLAVGGAQQNLSAQFLKDYSVALPPLPIQRKIAEILGAYDDLIENNRRRIALLEKMARELYRERFVRRAGATYAKKTLGDIGIRLESGSRPKGGIQEIAEGIPSVGAENVIGLGQYNYCSEKLISRDFFAKMKRGIIRDRDILLYKDGAYIGRVSLFQDGFPHKEAAINEHVFLIHANDETLQYYIFFTLAQERYFKIIQGLNENAAQPGLNQGSVLGLKIEWPDGEAIKAFDRLVTPLVAEIFSLALQNRNLTKQRDRLLPRLLSGRLEVAAAEMPGGGEVGG